MPPQPLRRPLAVASVLILGALTPVALALAAVARLLGARKPAIAVRIVIAYCLRELGVLAIGAGLWMLSAGARLAGRPRIQGLYWSALRWFVNGLAQRALDLLQIDVREDIDEQTAAALRGDAPLIVLSRHAGPGDTVFLIDRLISHWSRHPSIVLRKAVALDPAIDIFTSRLPHGVIDSAEGDAAERRIEELSAQLGSRGVLLLYPEGGNFTAERRRSALASLRRRGRRRAAAAAQRMAHVLPPRPSGVLAALRGNPDAPIVFVAHTGLGLAAYPGQIYRELPIGRTLLLRLRLAGRDEVPPTEEGQVQWLNQRWLEIDDWVDAHRAGERPS